MSALRLVWHEARTELRTGLRSGIVGLVFLGLAAYLLMSLTNADYVQKMGAADIPRNAPSLVYLMSTGCMFFLFFAWAWVFAQPLLRDRQASLHEVMLSMPSSLTAVLWGRFIGAALVGGVLAGSLIAGFIATPLLDWLSLVPHGSITAPPWAALAFAWFWLLWPVGIGIGALYFLATLRLRSVAGAFALSALLMLLWMFAVVVLKGGHINPMLAAALDPSLFTYALAKVETWTPAQKRASLLPLTSEFLFNRFLWCALPVLLLAVVLPRVGRESMALERPPRRAGKDRKAPSSPVVTGKAFAPISGTSVRWGRALLSEWRWQLAHVVKGKGIWIGVAILLVMGVVSGFVHGVWHAEGPMRARPEFLLPVLNSAMFLVVAFVVAALVGMVWRRDHVEGFDAMLDAAPAPSWLRPFGRTLAVVVIIVGLALLPGVASLVVTALAEPSAVQIGTPLAYQLLVTAPALLELGLLVLLVHACASRAGVAYTVSMLLTFFLVLNHELGLVDYPLYEAGIPAHLHLSGMTGWGPWQGYLLALDGYKLGGCVVMAALTAFLVQRGAEGRWRGGLRRMKDRLGGPVAVAFVVGIAVMTGLGLRLHEGLVIHGDYQPHEIRDEENAAWEHRWLHTAGAYEVSGGRVAIDVDAVTGVLQGDWTIEGVRAVGGNLHAELPPDLSLISASVDGRAAIPDIANDHLVLPLVGAGPTHTVRLRWTMPSPGWSAEGVPSWRGHGDLWLTASQAMPRLGLDPERIVRSPPTRKAHGLADGIELPAPGASVADEAVAPSGTWRWSVRIGETAVAASAPDAHARPLAFAVGWSPSAAKTVSDDLHVAHDHWRTDDAHGVASDVESMARCVGRRLGTTISIDTVVQWPRDLGDTTLAGSTLLLPESPDWDIADKGPGRWLRHAHIATAIARRTLVDTADLREAEGSAWWSAAVPGAIGLLCVGDVDGVDALRQTMGLFAERTSRALAGSAVPVERLDHASAHGWVSSYGPLAALGWTSRQSGDELAHISQRIASGQSVEEAAAPSMSDAERHAAFGPPRATELSVSPEHHTVAAQHWAWHSGGWTPLPETSEALLLIRHDDAIAPRHVSSGDVPDDDGIPVDILPSYARSSSRTPPSH